MPMIYQPDYLGTRVPPRRVSHPVSVTISVVMASIVRITEVLIKPSVPMGNVSMNNN